MEHWWHRDVVAAGKLPLMLCFLAFVLTFLVTRSITRLIRAGRGPFRDRVTTGGVHVHHAIPGLALLIVGAFVSVGSTSSSWTSVSAVLIGIGVSLVDQPGRWRALQARPDQLTRFRLRTNGTDVP